MLDLLLGTRRLRREIEAQAQCLERDIEHEQLARAQLRQTVIARATSPLGLACAVAAGFIAGKAQRARDGSPSRITTAISDSTTGLIGGIAAAALAAMRTVGWQIIMPAVVEWVRTKIQGEPNPVQNEN